MAPTIDFGPVQYGCTKYKRRMVIYESILLPGKRFEFCYSSSYKDKHGIETAYYKCVGCMHSKRYNDGKRIPKIAVRQGRLVNSNPDRPSNFPHFCQPIDSAVSERRQREREISNTCGQQSSSSSSSYSLPSFQINNIQQQQQQRSLNLEQQNKLKIETTIIPSINPPFNFNISSMNVMPISSSSTSQLINRGSQSMNEVMQQQIQQLAANCFASTNISPPINTFTSNNLLFGITTVGNNNSNNWWPITTTQPP